MLFSASIRVEGLRRTTETLCRAYVYLTLKPRLFGCVPTSLGGLLQSVRA
jgi:hypothetical protein